MPKIIPNDLILKIKELYLSGKSEISVAKELEISDKSVVKYLKKLNVLVRSRTYNFNESYFEKIDTQPKAYLLGYIFADGCVRKTKRTNTLRLKLHEKDIHILNFLQNELESDYNIKKDNGTNCKFVSISSLKIVNSLIKLGCVPKKSLILKYPNIDKEYWNSFIHGYFDGDGCVYFSSKKNNIQRQFKLLGTFDFLSSIKEYFNSVGIETYGVKEYPKSRIHQLRSCNKESLKKIYNLFYLNTNYNFLDRKKEIFNLTIE